MKKTLTVLMATLLSANLIFCQPFVFAAIEGAISKPSGLTGGGSTISTPAPSFSSVRESSSSILDSYRSSASDRQTTYESAIQSFQKSNQDKQAAFTAAVNNFQKATQDAQNANTAAIQNFQAANQKRQSAFETASQNFQTGIQNKQTTFATITGSDSGNTNAPTAGSNLITTPKITDSMIQAAITKMKELAANPVHAPSFTMGDGSVHIFLRDTAVIDTSTTSGLGASVTYTNDQGKVVTEYWTLDPSMLSEDGRSLDMLFKPEFNEKNLNIQFYKIGTDGEQKAVGNPVNIEVSMFRQDMRDVNFQVDTYKISGDQVQIKFKSPVDPSDVRNLFEVITYTDATGQQKQETWMVDPRSISEDGTSVILPTREGTTSISFFAEEPTHGLTNTATIDLSKPRNSQAQTQDTVIRNTIDRDALIEKYTGILSSDKPVIEGAESRITQLLQAKRQEITDNKQNIQDLITQKMNELKTARVELSEKIQKLLEGKSTGLSQSLNNKDLQTLLSGTIFDNSSSNVSEGQKAYIEASSLLNVTEGQLIDKYGEEGWKKISQAINEFNSAVAQLNKNYEKALDNSAGHYNPVAFIERKQQFKAEQAELNKTLKEFGLAVPISTGDAFRDPIPMDLNINDSLIMKYLMVEGAVENAKNDCVAAGDQLPDQKQIDGYTNAEMQEQGNLGVQLNPNLTKDQKQAMTTWIQEIKEFEELRSFCMKNGVPFNEAAPLLQQQYYEIINAQAEVNKQFPQTTLWQMKQLQLSFANETPAEEDSAYDSEQYSLTSYLASNYVADATPGQKLAADAENVYYRDYVATKLYTEQIEEGRKNLTADNPDQTKISQGVVAASYLTAMYEYLIEEEIPVSKTIDGAAQNAYAFKKEYEGAVNKENQNNAAAVNKFISSITGQSLASGQFVEAGTWNSDGTISIVTTEGNKYRYTPSDIDASLALGMNNTPQNPSVFKPIIEGFRRDPNIEVVAVGDDFIVTDKTTGEKFAFVQGESGNAIYYYDNYQKAWVAEQGPLSWEDAPMYGGQVADGASSFDDPGPLSWEDAPMYGGQVADGTPSDDYYNPETFDYEAHGGHEGLAY